MMSKRRSCTQVLSALSLALLGGCSGSEPISTPGAEQAALAQSEAELQALAPLPTVETESLCKGGTGTMRCFAQQVTSINGNPMGVSPAPIAGLTAQDIQSAYKLPATGGDGRLVAIVDAFDAPNAERDMGTYRQMYGLPPCTTANGCFRKLNQDGMPGPYPPPDPGWAGEIMVDLAMVSATCPGCKIVLIEAKSSNGVDLGPCVALAKTLGAVAVNNSYGGPESDPDSVASYQYYNQPGMLVVASSGDDGYLKTPNDQGTVLQEIAFPAASPYTMSVGGTSLRTSAGGRGWTETAWKGAGSGCSKSQNKPTWQKDGMCAKRFVADVAAIADPATGVAYYDGGWKVVGGTSVSAPVLAGIAGRFNITDPQWPYLHASAFFDVTSGNNGSCNNTYLCTAVPGPDGPTGLGTPNAATWTVEPPSDGGTTTTTGGAGAGGAGMGGRAGAAGSGGAGGAGGTSSGSSAGGNGGSGVSPVGAGGQTGTTTGAGGATTGGGGDSSTTTMATTTTTSGGGSNTTTTTTASGSGGSTTTPLAPKPAESSGCSCRVGAAESDTSTPWSGLAAIAMGLALARRRGRSGLN